MMLLTKGSKGKKVKELQNKLNKILNTNISLDGDFGMNTEVIVRQFQKKYKLKEDGVVGNYTWKQIEIQYNKEESSLLTFNKDRIVVFVDAGHGGIDDSGNYTTSGKRAFHADTKLHRNGH